MNSYNFITYQQNIKSRILISLFTSFILTAAFVMTSIVVASAHPADTVPVIIEDGWIEKMDQKIAVDLSLNNAFETFEVKTATNKFILSPNTTTNLKLNLNYRFISVGFEFAPRLFPGNRDDDLKGNTKSFSLGTSLIFKHWLFDLSYTKVKGYWLENSDEYRSMQPGDPYIQFPDLNYQGFSISSGYSSNARFSFRSLTSQTERQLKSAGSFIPVMDIRYFIIDDKSQGNATQKSGNLESSIGPGYIYTFVAKKSMYLSTGLMASAGYMNTKLTTRYPDGDVITYQDNFIFRWQGKAGIGYNGSTFYSGLYATLSGTQYKQENTTVMNFETRVYYHLFIGFRFTAPKFVKKQVSIVEDKLPL